MEFLVYGNVYIEKEAIDLKITKYLDINSKIIPLFFKYPIRGEKIKDFINRERFLYSWWTNEKKSPSYKRRIKSNSLNQNRNK